MRTHSKSNTAAPLNGLAIGAIIGAVMATFTGVFMFLIEFFLFVDHISFSGVKVAMNPLSLVVFPLLGWLSLLLESGSRTVMLIYSQHKHCFSDHAVHGRGGVLSSLQDCPCILTLDGSHCFSEVCRWMRLYGHDS